uniref:Glycosyltransferase family 92 protein n=1 Tax=Panagrellus redivivus TaxID=6233 RepID=A0A7E4VCA1_PANRE
MFIIKKRFSSIVYFITTFKLPEFQSTANAAASVEFRWNVFSFFLLVSFAITPFLKLWVVPALAEHYLPPKVPLHLVHLKSYYEFPDILPASHPDVITEHLVHIFFSNKNIDLARFPMECFSTTTNFAIRGRYNFMKISSNITGKSKSECGVTFYKLECPFVQSVIEDTYIRVNRGPHILVNASYADRKDRDLVYCMRPLHNGHHSWDQIRTFIEVARALDVNLIHAYVNSISADVLELLQKYELEKWIRVDPGYDFKQLETLPGKPFDSSSEYLYQTAAAMDCHAEHRQYTEFITFLDWNDLLLPRSRHTLPMEVAAIFGYNQIAVALQLGKNPAILRNTTKLDSLEVGLRISQYGRRFIYITQPRKIFGFTARGAVFHTLYGNRAEMRGDGVKTLTKITHLNSDYLIGLSIQGTDWDNLVTRQKKPSVVANFTEIFPDDRSVLKNFDLNDFPTSKVRETVNPDFHGCQIRANARLQSIDSRICPQTCPTIVDENTVSTYMEYKLGIQIDRSVFYHVDVVRNMTIVA